MTRPKFQFSDKPDANAANLIASLKLHGYDVIRIDKPVDILIYDPDTGRAGLAEIKSEKTTIRRSQIQHIVDHTMPCAIVKSEGEALVFAGTMEGFSDIEKSRMDAWLIRNPKADTIGQSAFEKLIGE